MKSQFVQLQRQVVASPKLLFGTFACRVLCGGYIGIMDKRMEATV